MNVRPPCWVIWVALNVFALFLVPAVHAQEPPVTEIRVEQEGQVLTDPSVSDLIETKVGEPVSATDVRETILHLMTLNRFDDVQVFQDAAAGGLRLRYVLIPQHLVDRVEFRGTLGVSEGDLRRVMTERFGTAPPRATQSDAVTAALKLAYREKGYPAANVSASVEATHAPHRASLVVTIQAGARAPIVDARVLQTDGNDSNRLMGAPDIKRGQPYSKDQIDRDLDRWAARLREQGYYEARATHGVTFPPDGAVVTVNVTLGPRVVVAFAGDPLPENERERLVPIRAEASVDEDLLENSSRAIEDYLLGRGFKEARVDYTRTPRDGVLTITFNVKRGPRYAVDDVEILGNRAVPIAELRSLFRVKEGEPFVQTAVDAGVRAIEISYRTRGFTRAQVRPTIVEVVPENAADANRNVDVTLNVTEGPRTLVRGVTFQGNSVVSEAELRALLTILPTRAFSAEEVSTDRDRIELEYRNRGYDSVLVTPATTFNEDGTQVDIRFTVAEGPQVFIDRVIIVGNERTKRETIERELLLRPGQPLGFSATVESRAKLAALGLFRRIQIEELRHGAEPRRDVLVRVEEARPTSIGGGGGVEGGFRLRTGEGGQAEERFELAPRGFFEIGRRNLWGKNRAANLFTRVSLRSRDITVNGLPPADPADQGGYGFNEYRVVGTFREPRAFDSSADVLLTGILEQAIRSSFNFLRREARAEAGLRVSRVYTVAARYSLERIELFDEQFTPDEQPLIDRLFPQFRLSTFSGSFLRDTRDDVLDSSKGTLVLVESDLAARAIGSEVGFVKTYVQGSYFYRLPTNRRMVVALNAKLGAAQGFPREVTSVDATGATIVEVVEDLPASERFFAGGDTTVRGFSLDRLGDASTISQSGFPTGGNGLIVLNSELRVGVFGPLQAVGFLDAGNVTARASDLRLTNLRGAAGFGFRFRSPVGPIRVDLGFKLDRRELSPGRLERRSVWHISLGQAF